MLRVWFNECWLVFAFVLLYVVEAKGDDFEDDVNEDFFPVRILVDRCRFLFLHCFVVL